MRGLPQLQQLLLLPVAAQAAISKDLVQALPGLAAELPSRLWSGYIEPSPGHMLHYVFMESWSDPKADPVAVGILVALLPRLGKLTP